MDPRAQRLYWQSIVLLLAAHLGGGAPALRLAIAVALLQALHFARRLGGLRPFPVQVRVVYLGLLLAGSWPPLALLHPLQLVGTAALLVADYCPLARLLALAPWNRRVPLSAALLRFVLLSPPAPGAIVDRIPTRV